MIIELVGLIYIIIKDLHEFLSYKEEDKIVDYNWLKNSGLEERMENEGYILRFVRFDLIESRKLEGYDFVYEIDRKKRIRYKIKLRDGNVLMCKKKYLYNR